MFRKNLRTAAAFAAVSVFASALSGCSSQPAAAGGSEEIWGAPTISPEAREIADSYFSGSRETLSAWKDIDYSTVIGSVDEPEHIPYFDIKFGDFFGEYMYYLSVYGIEDDMAEEVAESCRSYRVNIINYLTFEKMYMYTAEKEYGISPDTLTEEQLKEVRETADEVRKDWSSNFYASASEKLGEGASEEEIEKLCDEVIDAILEKCGVDYDMFYNWEISSKIQELTLTELLKKTKVTDEDVRKEYDALVESAKDAAENDPATYESTPVMYMAYVPEGTRKARHILLHFSEDNADAITEASTNGDEAEAARLAQIELDNGLRQKANEIVDELENGGDFSKILDENDGEDEHIVLQNYSAIGQHYIDDVYGVEEKGGVSNLLVTPQGVYIIQYTGDAEVTEADTDSILTQIREYLDSQSETNAQMKAFGEWTEKYIYNIDCDILKIDKSDLIQNGVGTDASISDN